MTDIKFIPPEVRDQLLQKADLESIIRHLHPELKKTGASLSGHCPSCGSTKFSLRPAKGIIKCFSCGLGAKDILGYLQKFKGMTYVESCIWLADHLNFDIPSPDYTPDARALTPSQPRSQQDSFFRDQQLAASGIPIEAQQIPVKVGSNDTVLDRYAVGSIDAKFQIVPGHDMLLHYFDLDGAHVTYTSKYSKTPRDYFRIRFKLPAAHPDHEGKPTRYKSPPGSSNHLWIPEYIRQKFAAKEHIETLVFVEGEKKADALCLAGIPSVGISGINNFANDNEMPQHIERLINGCSVVNVAFWLDSDLFDLKGDLHKHTDSRPRTFARAAIKFRAYFYKLQSESINIQTWLVHGTDTATKGADDLLISLGAELSPDHVLSTDFHAAIRSHTSKGTHVRVHQITSWSDYQIYELWHLHAPRAFMAFYKEELKQLPEFRINKHRYRWDADKSDFVSSQKLLPDETYWFTQETKYGPQVRFDYLNITIFLQRHGYYRQRIGPGKYRLIRESEKVLSEVYPDDIQEFVYEFTRQIEELSVLRMLMQGGTAYFGADKLKNLSFYTPSFIEPRRDRQVLCFADTFWLITPDKPIQEFKYSDLPGTVWANEVIDYKPTLIPDYLTIDTNFLEKCPLRVDFKHEDADINTYMMCTSDILWRDGHKTPTTWPRDPDDYNDKDWLRLNTIMTNLMDKIIATGYTVSNFMDPGSMKAVICMDAYDGRSGKSEGGTGKSLWAGMFEHLFSTHKINGKQARLTEDQFLYDGVVEYTRLILIDDCRKTTDFEAFFSFITGGVTSNSKGVSKFFAGLKRWILTTNFSIRGEDRSHLRRQYIIQFSDYFNMERDPYSIFGHSLFHEWDDVQWNYWYNFIAACLQVYMQHGLKTFAPDADVKRRRLRDSITETWLDALEQYFFPGSAFMNTRLEIQKFLDRFAQKNKSQAPYATKANFKEKVDMFCRYSGYDYNLPAQGKKDNRIRNADKGIEYFVISDEEFDINVYESKINMHTNIPGDAPEFE